MNRERKQINLGNVFGGQKCNKSKRDRRGKKQKAGQESKTP